MERNALVNLFITNAEAVSATVGSVAAMAGAFEYTVTLCEQKEACRLPLSGCEADLSDNAARLCRDKSQKIIAAPGLPQAELQQFQKMCRSRGIELITNGLRDHPAGIDIGFTIADFGIAETGTLVLDCPDEELRLATMISEIHIAVLPLSRLSRSAEDLIPQLKARMAAPPGYLAFITGASRTADIERVLTLGVHGPLEVHILLWEDG